MEAFFSALMKAGLLAGSLTELVRMAEKLDIPSPGD
jgi:hypothetical protein